MKPRPAVGTRQMERGNRRPVAGGFASAACCLLSAACALLSAAPADNPVLAIAGPDTLFRHEFRTQIAVQGIADLSSENIGPLLENWANGQLIYREAVRQGLGADETTEATIREYERQYYIGLMTRRLADTVRASQVEIYDYYNRRKLDFVTKVRFNYMALPDLATARQALKELNAKKDFKQVASERSLDRAVNAKAEAELYGRNDTTAGLDPMLEDTIFTLPVGKLSPPIQSGGAWWLVKPLERSFLSDTVSEEDARDFVGKLLELKRRRQVLEQAIAALRKKAKVSLTPPKGDSLVLASVNGSLLTRRFLNLQYQGRNRLAENELPYLVDAWAKSELLYQEARRLNLGDDDTTRLLLRDKRQEFLTDMLIEQTIGSVTVPSTEVFDYFQQHKEEFLNDVRIVHILVGSDSLASALREQIRKGAEFLALARERSYDRAVYQGQESRFLDRLDIGNDLSPYLEDVIFRLPAGGTSDVVHTKEGYWIVRVTDRKKVRNDVSFEQAREKISTFLTRLKSQQRLDALLEELKKTQPVAFFPQNYWN